MFSTPMSLLQRVLVNMFYKANAGFFLFLFFALFGVITPGQLVSYHLSLIRGMVESPVFLGCVMILWCLYALKCNSYIRKQLRDPRNHFLQVLNKLPVSQQYRLLLQVNINIYMPVLVYAVIVAGVAIKQHFLIAMIAVVAFNLLMILVSAYCYVSWLQKKEWGFLLLPAGFHLPIGKPLFSLPAWFLVTQRKQMLFITKTFTLLLLYIFMALYEPTGNDVRALLLIILMIAAAHCVIVLQVRVFEDEFLLFSRNLPVALVKRFAGLMLLYLIILLPELLFVWKAFPAFFPLYSYPQLLLFAIALPLFFHAILLMEDIDTDSYLRFVFMICAVLFFVILYDPGILLSLSLISLSFLFFHSHFYTFEKKHR